MITRLKTTATGHSYHLGSVAIFTQRSGCRFVPGNLNVPLSRAAAAETLQNWRQIQEIAREAVIRELARLDNGLWTDDDSQSSGYPRLSFDEAVQCLDEVLQDPTEARSAGD
jgi:hypothetical protein